MSSQDSTNQKLFVTALAAAATGAALAVTALKLWASPPPHYDYQGGYDPVLGRSANANAASVIANPPVDESPPDDLETSSSSLRRNTSELIFPHNHEEKMRRRVATRYSIEEENNTPRQSVTVRVPATSANVGPGCKKPKKIFVYC